MQHALIAPLAGLPQATCYDFPRRIIRQKDYRLNRPADASLESNLTIEQLRAARSGDREALNQLFERLAPPLQRWARGRLPGWARGMVSTVDLVQETLLSTYLAIGKREPDADFAIHAYLRTALKNRLIDQLRRVQRRPALDEMDRSHEGDDASPLEAALGSEALERYEAGLAALSDSDREAVIARVELGLPYADIAGMLGKSSTDAARMAVSRALVKLAEAMGND